MMDTDLDSLEKLLSEATPAPWTVGGLAIDENCYIEPGVVTRGYESDGGVGREDAAAIAALRNLAPALIEEIRTGRAWRKEAEALLATFDAESREKLRAAYPTLFL